MIVPMRIKRIGSRERLDRVEIVSINQLCDLSEVTTSASLSPSVNWGKMVTDQGSSCEQEEIK